MNISKDGGTNVSLTQPPFNNRRPDEEAVVSDTLPLKYQGTSTDQQDMMLLGKKQVLRVREYITSIFHFTNLSNYVAEL